VTAPATVVPPVTEGGPAPHDVVVPQRAFGVWYRFRHDVFGMVGLTVILLLLLVALFPNLFAPHSTLKQHLRAINHGPTGTYLLGQDDLGRDVLSRLIFATRISVVASAGSVGLALTAAIPLGLVAGFAGRGVDTVIMRITDALQAIPALVLALAIRGMLGPSLLNLTLALAVVFVPGFLRLVRGQVLSVREETYIEASRSIGAKPVYILRKRVFHNIASPLIVQTALVLGQAMIAEAALSFLGLGASAQKPSWGQMLFRAYGFVVDAPWLIFVPGMAIVVSVLAFNLVGDALRDALGTETRGA
jgi:ABC-type dipeptide/oligopeptide/nickel transport system permease subunit